MGPLGILELCLGHVSAERMQTYIVQMDDKHTLCRFDLFKVSDFIYITGLI